LMSVEEFGRERGCELSVGAYSQGHRWYHYNLPVA